MHHRTMNTPLCRHCRSSSTAKPSPSQSSRLPFSTPWSVLFQGRIDIGTVFLKLPLTMKVVAFKYYRFNGLEARVPLRNSQQSSAERFLEVRRGAENSLRGLVFTSFFCCYDQVACAPFHSYSVPRGQTMYFSQNPRGKLFIGEHESRRSIL